MIVKSYVDIDSLPIGTPVTIRMIKGKLLLEDANIFGNKYEWKIGEILPIVAAFSRIFLTVQFDVVDKNGNVLISYNPEVRVDS